MIAVLWSYGILGSCYLGRSVSVHNVMVVQQHSQWLSKHTERTPEYRIPPDRPRWQLGKQIFCKDNQWYLRHHAEKCPELDRVRRYTIQYIMRLEGGNKKKVQYHAYRCWWANIEQVVQKSDALPEKNFMQCCRQQEHSNLSLQSAPTSS